MKLKQTIIFISTFILTASVTLTFISSPAGAAVICEPGETLVNNGKSCSPTPCPKGYSHVKGSATCTDSHKCSPAQNYNAQSQKCEDKSTATTPANSTNNCKTDGSSYSTSIIPCPSSKDGQSAINGLLLMGIKIMTVGIGIAAVGGVAYAGILYATAEDKAAQVTKAKMIIFDVVLGVGTYFLMYAFLQFLIPGGAFN